MLGAHATSRTDPMARRISVLLPLPLAEAYDYRLPGGLAAPPGSFVRVPFGPRRLVGVVWDHATGRPEGERPNEVDLKDVRAVLDLAPLPESLRRLIDWVAAYTLAPRGAVLRMAMSVPAALDGAKPRIAYRLGPVPPERLTEARARVLAILRDGRPREAKELAREAAVGPGVIRTLARAGALIPVTLAEEARASAPDWARPGPALSPDQASAARYLAERVAEGRFSTTLLDGVTGAGKTEVYFHAIAAALRRGRQVLVLLPEIALGAQLLGRFTERFGTPPAEWHSDLGQRQRRETWCAVARGAARVVVGARSALFLPFPELGLIVVDEEHEGAFKQEEGVIYNARDMAIVRARLENIPCVLVSATPSLETVVNARQGRYGRVHLPARHAGASLPRIEVIDMRLERPSADAWLSPRLGSALAETLEAGEQAMLFLNRRGYAPLTLCRACGHRLQCRHCAAWLVEHRRLRRLQCHHCGYSRKRPERCPACGAAESLAALGPGVERLAEEAAKSLPHARIALAASDTLTGPRAAGELIRRITERHVDLIVGTQILAKGHHFPMLTLVGVVDADLGLTGGDPRAAERTYQLLHQVAGRAGRGDHPGRVLLQSYMPDHPVMQALVSGERDRFLESQAAERQALGLPPFARLAALIVSGPDEAMVMKAARALGRAGPREPGLEVLGPAPAPLAVLRGHHRQRLLVKAAREKNLQASLRAWLAAAPLPKGIRVKIDVDPYSFL